ncbi:Hsp20/alpha crystallin family protein [Natrinema halophilum]|uniref:Hsp20/alpha crystallin family protein n=1 Tax=Natrinema halophilum TaxID=1699371 RepID=UPI001F3C813D|nr:Hsp20/alpha crystallin family protein [Natrinema halophilum]UHQ96092.1 Hsp20/alpha crystallin family protein [Natrinema halophilum]
MTDESDPFDGFEKQLHRLQQQFENITRMWDRERFGLSESEMTTMGIDLVDHGDEFVLTADVPGFESDDIDVRLSNNTLHVTAERDETTEEQEELYIKSERAHRSISRSVRLPEPVDEENVSAAYNNGVLTLTLPKRQPSDIGSHRIEVE